MVLDEDKGRRLQGIKNQLMNGLADKRSEVQTDFSFPKDCDVETLPDGSLRISMDQASRDWWKRQHVFTTALLNGIVFAALLGSAMFYGVSALTGMLTQVWHHHGAWVVMLIGIDSLAIVMAVRPAPRTPGLEWIARPGGLERRIRWPLGGNERWMVKRYTVGGWELIHTDPTQPSQADSPPPEWQLIFHARMDNGRGAKGEIWSADRAGVKHERPRSLADALANRAVQPADTEDRMRNLAEKLSEHTGWPLYYSE